MMSHFKFLSYRLLFIIGLSIVYPVFFVKDHDWFFTASLTSAITLLRNLAEAFMLVWKVLTEKLSAMDFDMS